MFLGGSRAIENGLYPNPPCRPKVSDSSRARSCAGEQVGFSLGCFGERDLDTHRLIWLSTSLDLMVTTVATAPERRQP